jgi:hypothetical protein
MGCSGVGGASTAAYLLPAASAKAAQSLSANAKAETDILAQLSSGTDLDGDSDGSDGTIDVTV